MRVRALVCVLVLLLAHAAHAEPGDYRADSPAWNGLSRFYAEAQAQGCSMSQANAIDWARLGPRDVLFFIYPQGAIDPDALGDFLTRGGRVLIADDFGAAGPALEALQLHRSAARLEGVPREPGHPELPVARVSLLTALGRSTPQITANHPAAFETSLPATYSLSPAQALVVEGHVGKGRFIALADPSVLINNMMELPSNAAFARALFTELCAPGTDGDRVHVLSRAFRADAPASHARSDQTSAVGRINDVLNSMNRATEDLLRGLFALPAALIVCGAALALAWQALSRARHARHGDGRFARVAGAGARTAWALIDAQPRGDEASEDGYALALSALRMEILRRVAVRVGTLPSTQTRAQRLNSIAAALGFPLREAYESFISIGPEGEGPIERAVARTTFSRATLAARTVLTLLAEHASRPSQGAT
jgi:hypothetical protein